MPFLYAAQSRDLNRNFRIHSDAPAGYLVKLGRATCLETRVRGLRGLIDGDREHRYAGRTDWAMWRCRWVPPRWDIVAEERALLAHYNAYNLRHRRSWSTAIADQEWSRSQRQELFFFPTRPRDLLRIFPYPAALQMPQGVAADTISDTLLAVEAPPPNPAMRNTIVAWNDRKAPFRPPPEDWPASL